MNKSSSKAALAAAILTVSLALTGCATTVVETSDPGMSEMAHDMSKLTETAGFAQMMVPHHMQALTMAAYAKENAKDPKVLALAKQIYTGQAAEIETMKVWIDGGEMPAGAMTEGMLSDAEMKTLSEAKGADFDKLFLEQMTVHHQGALAMATSFQNTDNAELKKLVTQILQTQTIELSMMKLLAK